MSEPDRLDARLPFSGRKRKSEKFLRSSSLSRPINTAPYVAFKYYDIAKPMTYLPATLFAAPGVANRQWLKSLGPELEKVVREESHKAEEVFGEWNINDIKSKEEVCTSDASKADWIASATKRTITEKMDEDPAFYRQFSELLEEAIRDYREKRISEGDYLKNVVDLASRMARKDHGRQVPESINGDEDAQAVFGIVEPVVCTENSIHVSESPNVGDDDRAVLPLPGPIRLAVQVEEPT